MGVLDMTAMYTVTVTLTLSMEVEGDSVGEVERIVEGVCEGGKVYVYENLVLEEKYKAPCSDVIDSKEATYDDRVTGTVTRVQLDSVERCDV